MNRESGNKETGNVMQNITLMLDGAMLKVRVPIKDEALYRKAASRINLRIDRYRSAFPHSEHLPPKGYLMMAALDSAFHLQRLRQEYDHKPIDERIDKLNRSIELVLDKYKL